MKILADDPEAIRMPEAARLMIEAGLPVRGIFGQHHATPLHWAAWHGNATLLRLILVHRPDLEDADNDFKSTPLGWALHGSRNGWHRDRGNYPETVMALLEAGARIPPNHEATEAVEAVLQEWGFGGIWGGRLAFIHPHVKNQFERHGEAHAAPHPFVHTHRMQLGAQSGQQTGRIGRLTPRFPIRSRRPCPNDYAPSGGQPLGCVQRPDGRILPCLAGWSGSRRRRLHDRTRAAAREHRAGIPRGERARDLASDRERTAHHAGGALPRARVHGWRRRARNGTPRRRRPVDCGARAPKPGGRR